MVLLQRPKLQVKFNGSCLEQEKVTFTHKKVVNITTLTAEKE